MDIDEAWDNFRSKSFQKASVQEQLDTLAAAINEIKTDTSRTAEIVPQIMGDNAAIDSANAEAGAAMPGAPDMMGGMGGEDMNAMDEQMPPEGGDMGADMGGEMGAEAPVPGAEDMTPPDMGGGAEPPMEGGGEYAGESEDDYMSDEDIDALLDSIYGGMEEEPTEDIPAEGVQEPMIPASGGAGLAEATNNLLAALKQAAHEAVDQNNIDRVVELSHIEQQIMQTLGNEVGIEEPTMGEVPDMGAPVPEEQTPMDLPFDPEAAPDVSEGAGGEEIMPEETEEAPEMEEEVEVEEKDDEDDEDVKKSATCDAAGNSPESFEKDGEAAGDGMAEGTMGEEIEGVVKSEGYVPPSPSFKDMMSGRVDIVAFMKGDCEGYIDEAQIYKDPAVDPIEGGIDGKTSFMKADDRIATARSIFDMPMSRSGHKDPASIATAGEAQEALAHTGEQDPDSISTADKIIDVKKSAEDIGEISASSGSTDPDSIASAGTAQQALSHQGTQDPESVATAKEAVNMGSGNDSEGSKESIDISIEKSVPAMFSEEQVREAIKKAYGADDKADFIIESLKKSGLPNVPPLESYDETAQLSAGHGDMSPAAVAAAQGRESAAQGREAAAAGRESAAQAREAAAQARNKMARANTAPEKPPYTPQPMRFRSGPKMPDTETEEDIRAHDDSWLYNSTTPDYLFDDEEGEPDDMSIDLPEGRPIPPNRRSAPTPTAQPYSRSYGNEPSLGELMNKYEPYSDNTRAYNDDMESQATERRNEQWDGIYKAAGGGKHMMTLNEAFTIAKSNARPNMASAMGDAENPDLNRIQKSSKPIVRMGRGVDPLKVIENDLEEWNLYKARSKF